MNNKYIVTRAYIYIYIRQHSLNGRWDSVSINLIDVLSASRNLFFSDSFDLIAVFKTIRDTQRTRNILKVWSSILLFAIFRQRSTAWHHPA